VDQKLLTVVELAQYLDVPVQTVYAWNTRGTGPKRVKIGKHVRYRPADVERWLESGGPAACSA